MFSMFSTERWADLYKAQLIMTNGMNIENWGFPCLFFDSKFNTLLQKNYMQINSITGEYFHIFSFIDPPEKLINNRLTLLNERWEKKEINYDFYMKLREELHKMKYRPTTSNQNIDYEREIIREEIIRAYRGEIDSISQIDIIVFDINSLQSDSKEINAYIINTTFTENDLMKMLEFINKISKYSKEIYFDNIDGKFERILDKLTTEGIKMNYKRIAGNLLNIMKNIKGIF